MRGGEHELHVGLQRRRHRLAEQKGVQQRLHLHDVVVDVALVLDELLAHAVVQLGQVVSLADEAAEWSVSAEGVGHSPHTRRDLAAIVISPRSRRDLERDLAGQVRSDSTDTVLPHGSSENG